ncbi:MULTISPECIES: alpha/beta fold hydrolase [unclassified Rhodococcus (in: high G+C Gram-positive bacteria)]|uniref:alpha/beta fold hydrolase n=1 Tax=Rhodococcus sp. SJ-3 TaxID=3454628 RepID=UPI002D819230|nr:alpha/beta fold hydrolase [Rhodococcus sp. (in: high G+C Gram-positive bacteria)]
MAPVTHTQIAAAPIRIGAAAIAGWSSYLLGLARRGPTPWTIASDIGRYYGALTDNTPPTWAHAWPVARRSPLAALRDCSDRDAVDRESVPTLLLPPQAGTHSCIVDHTPGRSQVEALRAGGLTRLYCLDWTPANAGTDFASIDEHLAVVADAVAHLGGLVNIVGDSQGGWLGTIYAALHPEAVRTLTVAGSPIDFHAEQPALAALAQAPAGAAASVVDFFYGTARAAGVQSTDPVGEIERALALLGALDDPDEVSRMETERRWFAWRQEVPATFREWIMRRLFVGNELIAGTLVAEGRTVDLAAIECPLRLIAGNADPMATPVQVTALAKQVSTPPSEIVTTIVDTGHIGLFIGRRSLADVWTPFARSLAAIS